MAALRCVYQRAVDDGLIAGADNPARKVAKPRRLPSTRRAVPDARLAEINEAAAATGNDPEGWIVTGSNSGGPLVAECAGELAAQLCILVGERLMR